MFFYIVAVLCNIICVVYSGLMVVNTACSTSTTVCKKCYETKVFASLEKWSRGGVASIKIIVSKMYWKRYETKVFAALQG